MLTETQIFDIPQTNYEWNPNLTEPELQPTSYEIWQQKYQLKNEKQDPIDLTVSDTFKRVAKALSRSEPEWYEKFLWALNMGATPAGRIMSNAGAEEHKPSVSTINCTVSQIVKDSMKGILEANLDAGLTLAAGCGIGYEFSTLRPRGAFVSGAGAYTSGSLSFMDIFDSMCFTVASAGGRRGAMMATFAVWHPDVEAFIVAKREDGRFRQFNCSLLIDDEFMEAVKNDSNWDLRFPVRPKELEKGIVKKNETVWKPIPWERTYCEEMDYILDDDMMLFKIYKTIKAKELWDTIMKSTYDFAEPGFLLIDRINQMNNNYFCEQIRATNPCVSGDTPVLTDQGWVNIYDVIEKPISVWNGFDWSTVTPKVTGTNQKMVTVFFSDGSSLRCTEGHKFILSNNTRVEAVNLQVGDKLEKNEWPTISGSVDHNIDYYGQGFFAGDGWVKQSTGAQYIGLYGVKRDVPHQWNEFSRNTYNIVGGYVNTDTSLVKEYLMFPKGTFLDKTFIPFDASIENKRLWLAGLMDSDGCITKDGSIQISAKSREFLMDVKFLLNTMGSNGSVQSMKDCWRISISPNRVKKLNVPTKRLAQVSPSRDSEHFLKVTGIQTSGIEETVYCFTEEKNHSGIFNGVYTAQCGEQPLPPEGSCLLGSINLAKFVSNPFSDHAEFDFDTYADVVRVFSRMLDNVVELNGLPLEGQRREIENKRRHGMGFLGLGTTLSLLGMEYGSKESVEFTEEVAKTMAIEGYRAGIDLAEEKGPAPLLGDTDNRKAWIKSKFMKRIWKAAPTLKERALEHGCRYTHATSIAPTGTISLSVNNNVSNGIEPSFSHKYTRNVIKEGKKSKEAVDVYSYEMLLWKHFTGNDDVPAFFSTSDNITPKAHVDIQAAAQKWCDSSISKTINVPTDTPFDEFKDIYLYAYEKGLKGTTIFRFNPAAFQGVLVTEDNLKKTIYRFTTDEGEIIEVAGNEKIMYDGEEHSAANLYDAIKENYFGKF